MFVKTLRPVTVAALAAAALVTLRPLAFADENFNGTWVVDIQSAGFIADTNDSVCPALRFPVTIKDGEVTGTLTRVPSRDGTMIVEAGTGTDSASIKGTVSSDGTVNAQWEHYDVSGKLHGDAGEITVKGECGPRTGQAVRVSK